jgi:hypothetical protein
MPTFPNPGDLLSALNRADGTAVAHSNDHGQLIGGVFNVKGYGAVGDGTTDDTAAITATITAAVAGGITPPSGISSVLPEVFFPAGVYQCSNLVAPVGSVVLRGAGPQRTYLQAKTGSTGVLVDLSFAANTSNVSLRDMTLLADLAPTMTLLRTSRTNFLHLNRLQFRYGGYGWEHVQIQGAGSFEAADMNYQNQTSAAIHITGTSGLGNAGGIRDVFIQVTAAGVEMAQAILVDWFTTGIVFDNIQALGNLTLPGLIHKGFVYTSGVPTGAQGAFLHLSNNVFDQISTPGAAMELTNARGVWSVGDFLSPESTGSGSSISIDGGREISILNGWLSGKGISFANAPDHVIVGAGNQFPQTIAGGALVMPASNPPTNLVVDEAVLFYSSITNDPGKLDTATNNRFRWKAAYS